MQLEFQLTVLTTLALVAFGLVMVFSATSATATLGGGSASAYLVRQAVSACVGLVAMISLTRFDYRYLRTLAPTLLVAALGLCLAVLVIGVEVKARNGSGARESLEIPLHPVGGVAGQTVFPAPEPEKHKAQPVTPRSLDHTVQHFEVELPFLRFDLVPGNAHQGGFEIGLDEPGPYRPDVLEAGSGVVV